MYWIFPNRERGFFSGVLECLRFHALFSSSFLSFFTLTSRSILLINVRSGIFSGKQEKNPYKASISRVRGLNVPKAKEAAKLLRDTFMIVFFAFA